MNHPNEPTTRTTISLPLWLADKARANDVSLSRFVQQALPDFIKELEAEAWFKRNRVGIEELNAYTQEHGIATAKLRMF